tara:strand:- start:406 stop:1521 length:1116 start_codon:yes stop_codon:yes gene_type:complete
MAEKPTDFKDPVKIDLAEAMGDIPTSDEAKLGDLAIIEESPIPSLDQEPQESNWKKAGRAASKIARFAARRSPIGLVIDAIANWPTDKEVKENIEKVTKGSENIVDDIVTLVKGMKGEDLNRREFLRGGKAAAQVLGTPKPDILSKKDPWKTAGGGGYLHKGLPKAAGDKLFDLWRQHSEKIFRRIYFEADTKKEPKDLSGSDIEEFKETFRYGLKNEIAPDEEVVLIPSEQEIGIDDASREVYNRPRLIPDYRNEFDNRIGSWVWDYADPPTQSDIEESGRGSFSDYEHIIQGVYEDWDDPDSYDYPYDSLGEMYYQEGLDNAKEFEKFIRKMKDQGIKQDEIYDLWKEGAERYLMENDPDQIGLDVDDK